MSPVGSVMTFDERLGLREHIADDESDAPWECPNCGAAGGEMVIGESIYSEGRIVEEVRCTLCEEPEPEPDDDAEEQFYGRLRG